MSHDSLFAPTPEGPKSTASYQNKIISATEGDRPKTDEDRIQGITENYSLLTAYDGKSYRKISEPESTDRYGITGIHAVSNPGGMSTGLEVDSYELSMASDPETKRMVEVRVHKRKYAPSGEPVFSTFLIDALKFFEEYEPDGWMSASERQSVLKKLKPIMDYERQLTEEAARVRAAEEVKLEAARAARANPSGFLADALAVGIAAALKNLNTKKAGAA